MLNEGFVVSGSKALIKSEVVRQISRLSRTTPDRLERAVFEALTGHRREDVDWNVEDNKAGYFLWTKSFDNLITELVDDGYIAIEKEGQGSVLVAVEREPEIGISQIPHPNAGDS
jgi:hypothetical protein